MKDSTVAGSTIHYDDVYGDMYKQKAMVTRFIHRMNIRNKVIEENKELTSEREQITARTQAQDCAT